MSRRPKLVVSIGAGLVLVLTVVVVLVVVARTPVVVAATVGSAEALPEPTTSTSTTTTTAPPPEETVPPETAPPESTTTTEPVTPDYHLRRPSTVLQGKTPGVGVPVYDAPNGRLLRTFPHPRSFPDATDTVPLVFLAKQVQGDWAEAYLPVRPNGSTGWVRTADVTMLTHDYVIEVRLRQFNLKVYDGSTLIMDTAIGEATDNSPTPGGLYYITELLAPPDPNGPYGPYAYGLSGFSNVYQSFAGGPGQLGIHGTNQPQFIGGKVSHGCIRVRNADITRLAKLLPLGVPVLVYP